MEERQATQQIGRWLFGLSIAATTLMSFLVPDDLKFQKPELARIFFFHFPCAIATTIFLVMAAIYSLKFLRKGGVEYDVKALASQELGTLFALLTLATGMLFSKVQWGAWWQWDPRQTSFLLVICVLFAYFALRGAHQDETRRRTNAAVYAVCGFLPLIFLIFVFPRLPHIVSFHPNDTVSGGLLKGGYRTVVMAMLVLITTLSIWIFRMRVRAELLEIQLEEYLGKLETRGSDSTPTGVVRPISLPPQG